MRSERGSATVLTIALLCALLCFGAFGLAFGQVVVLQTRLSQLADEAARAGAYALLNGGDPCEVAAGFVRTSVNQTQSGSASVTSAHATRLVRCENSGALTVTVAAPLPPFLQPLLAGTSLHATARAGS